MNGNTEERCACGGLIVSGHMYGDQFIYGDVDLQFAFRGKEYLLRETFPDGIPVQGEEAKMCSKCFKMLPHFSGIKQNTDIVVDSVM